MFEIKHLKTLSSIEAAGNIRKAAETLFISQSALSHQLKDLEQRLNTPLFIRNTSPVQFTTEGEILLSLAHDILPKINHSLLALKQVNKTETKLSISMDCHACFQWLLPVTEQFTKQHPELTIEFLEQIFAHQDKKQTTADIVFTDEKCVNENYTYQALGTFEVVAVFAKTHHNLGSAKNLHQQAFLTTEDFNQQVLLTYPVKAEKLDIFKLFLNKSIDNNELTKPKAIKHVANSHMILQMVAANMGIATLPKWLVNSLTKQSLVQTKRIGEAGIFKTLYARYQNDSKHLALIKLFIPHAIAAFNRL
ncbi:HTH-type transcriptional regulator MetR [Colwellia sp. KU-HH00111]|uniref:LysR substrate-binding domain-containing protein n=1 Tax=Colwellia sp. KU-HH00111 TaxID=3127652 RepID=UPI00310A98FC